ncbi:MULTISPECIES: hypothetical protein [Shinella]|jgi:hypothetical protein|uniref:hypothetical protein n=1 Tax=Shinella TaxID=323620 RepID=UPI001AC94991|nr:MULTISPECIES: hypothetical protein [Shinella]MBN9052503.1 hypothetical protein [Hyphomicrobiales bacterium]MCW5710608.1 hypothetical protein [Shinella sp.]
MAIPYDLHLLAELIDEAVRSTPIRKLPRERRRRYQAKATARSRQRVAAALAGGIVPVNRRHVRDVLGDAAMHILSSGGDGADIIRQALATVFAHDPDAPATIADKIRAGKIRPRLFRPA